MNVFIYLRKSRKDIEEERKHGGKYDTLERHRKQLMALVRRKNLNLVKKPFEEVVSGESVAERPKMQELLKRVENGEVDAVVVMDLDRLGRGDMLDQGMIDRAFRYSGTLLITPSETYDPSSQEWELVFGIKSLVARGELKAITRRMQGGRRQSAKEGKSISKKPPYGYTRDENLILHPDKNTSWVIEKIFEMSAEGIGRQSIALELDRIGIKPPDSRRDFWSPSMIPAIIKNEAYKGDIVWGKFKYVKRNGHYHRRKTDKSEWIVHENAHEAIVSKELWEKANKSLTSRMRTSVNLERKLANPLAGILKCAICGRSMLATPRPTRRSSNIRCANPKCRGKQKGAYLDDVEEVILQGLQELVDRFVASPPTHKEDNAIPIKKQAIKKKEKEIAELHEQKNSLHDLLEKKVYDIDTFLERQSILLEKIKDAEKIVAELKEEIQTEEIKRKNEKDYIPSVRKVIEAYYQTDDPEKKNRLLKSILEKATYLRKKEWKKKEQFEIRLYPRI